MRIFVRFFGSLIGAAILALALTSEAPADDKQPRFGVIGWFPLGYTEDGVKKGLFFDIANALNAALDIKSDIIMGPVPRIFRGMVTGDFDLTLSFRGKNREKELDYLVDLGCLNSLVISLKTKPITNLEQLNGLRVAYSGGGYFATMILPSLNLDGVEIVDNKDMFRMILRNRLDAFIVNDAVWQGYRNDLSPAYKIPSGRWADFAEPLTINTVPIALSMSQKSPHKALAPRFRSIMSDPDFAKALQAIYEKHHLTGKNRCG